MNSTVIAQPRAEVSGLSTSDSERSVTQAAIKSMRSLGLRVLDEVPGRQGL